MVVPVKVTVGSREGRVGKSMKLGEAMYKQTQESGAAPGGPGGGADASGGKKEDVVDAEFTEVDDDKKNKKSA